MALQVTNSPVASNPAMLGQVYAANTLPAAQAPAANAQAAGTPNQRIATGYDPTPVSTGTVVGGGQSPATSGGGAVGDFLGGAAVRLAAMANEGRSRTENQMSADTTAAGGMLNQAQVQKYMSQINTWDQLNALAKKVQDSQDQAIQIWLR